jgi:hypothetical protein
MHRLIKRGLIRPNRYTRHLLFPVAELDRFLRDGQTEVKKSPRKSLATSAAKKQSDP